MFCIKSIWFVMFLVVFTAALETSIILSDEQEQSPEDDEVTTMNNDYEDSNLPGDGIDDDTSVESTAPTDDLDGMTYDDDDGNVELTTLFVGGSTPGDDDPMVVHTDSGAVKGFQWKNNENVIGFYDIPYGTFSSPFQAATAPNKWTLHQTETHTKVCPQLIQNVYIGDTDCLTLSVFKPKDVEKSSVLFHIHSENFDTGSGDPFIYGPDYLVNNNVILVLPNYRLGPLGFLCLQNQSVPGNMALKDLSMALHWVHSNIEAFGGDPNNIAVSGDGKSGALAGLLGLYPMSKGILKKVITESGSFFSYWSLDREPTVTAAAILEKIRESNNEQSRVDISLDTLDVKTIVQASRGFEFKPCIEIVEENAFMTLTPYEVLIRDKIDTLFLIGSATYAGAHEASGQTYASIRELNKDSTLLLPNDLTFSSVSLKQKTGERVKTQYFGEDPIRLSDLETLAQYFTDIGYLGPGIRSARQLVAAGATVFFYEFAFAGKLNRVLETLGLLLKSAVRRDIVGYLFTHNGEQCKHLVPECRLVEELTAMATNFLKSGSPSTEAITWNSLKLEEEKEEEYLHIDTELSIKKGIHPERLSLWTEIYRDHFIDKNRSSEISSSAYVVVTLQCFFFLAFCKNASYMF